jgi:sialate O-acetylesterase
MKPLLAIVLTLITASAARADITLPAIIDSQMVLQRGVAAPIWGWADEGETVTVTFAGQTKTAIASGEKGKWMVKLDPLKASATPGIMIVKGKNEIKLTDVLVGEVWLATGQSNMEYNIACLGDKEKEVVYAQGTNSLFRMFCIPGYHRSSTPLDSPVGSWSATPEFAADLKAGKIPRFYSHSAVGCFFGFALQRELGVPVAVIDSCWGGQRIENFISPECYNWTFANSG